MLQSHTASAGWGIPDAPILIEGCCSRPPPTKHASGAAVVQCFSLEPREHSSSDKCLELQAPGITQPCLRLDVKDLEDPCQHPAALAQDRTKSFHIGTLSHCEHSSGESGKVGKRLERVAEATPAFPAPLSGIVLCTS